MLNPLHKSIRPVGQDTAAAQDTPVGTQSKPRPKQTAESARTDAKSTDGEISQASTAHTEASRSSARSRGEMDTPNDVHFVPVESRSDCPRNAKTGEIIPGISFSEIGMASRFGDKTLVQEVRCTVFEVVLQSREATMCPACGRNPQRARLPARKWSVHSTAWRR